MSLAYIDSVDPFGSTDEEKKQSNDDDTPPQVLLGSNSDKQRNWELANEQGIPFLPVFPGGGGGGGGGKPREVCDCTSLHGMGIFSKGGSPWEEQADGSQTAWIVGKGKHGFRRPVRVRYDEDCNVFTECEGGWQYSGKCDDYELGR